MPPQRDPVCDQGVDRLELLFRTGSRRLMGTRTFWFSPASMLADSFKQAVLCSSVLYIYTVRISCRNTHSCLQVLQGCPRVPFIMSDSGKSLVGSMNRTRMICFPRLQVKSSHITGDSEILYITIAYYNSNKYFPLGDQGGVRI